MGLLLGAPQRRKRIASNIKSDAARAKPALLQAVTNKTIKEVELKQMSPPMTEDQVAQQHGKFWNGVQCYGIGQGFEQGGSVKYRCIGNYLDNENNAQPTESRRYQ